MNTRTITKARLDAKIDKFNKILTDRKAPKTIRRRSYNGTNHLELLNSKGGCLENLFTGTTGECYRFINTMTIGIWLAEGNR